jgi:hypothetical protein
VERRKKKEKNKKNERSDNDDGVGRCEEKKKKKKTERYLVYWGLFYFGAIFKLKLSCYLRIGCCKSWVL